MANEIERKFLVSELPSSLGAGGASLVQGYLPLSDAISVRVRLSPEGSYLTLKGPLQGNTRQELECEIPQDIAEVLLVLSGDQVVAKTRHPVLEGDRVWIVDVFLDENEGLILAEIELSSPDEDVVIPSWCGTEVTQDSRYYNLNLARKPFQSWNDSR